MFSIRKSDKKLTNILNVTVMGKVVIVICLNYNFLLNKNFNANVSHWCVNCLSVYVECAERVKKYYGEEFSPYFSLKAKFLEFASINNKTNVKVLWNASDVYTESSRVTISWLIGRINDVTQLDNGYYNLRKEDNSLIWRKLLIVEGDEGRLVDVLAVPGQMKHSHKLFILFPQQRVKCLKKRQARWSSSVTLPWRLLGMWLSNLRRDQGFNYWSGTIVSWTMVDGFTIHFMGDWASKRAALRSLIWKAETLAPTSSQMNTATWSWLWNWKLSPVSNATVSFLEEQMKPPVQSNQLFALPCSTFEHSLVCRTRSRVRLCDHLHLSLFEKMLLQEDPAKRTDTDAYWALHSALLREYRSGWPNNL